MSRDIGIDLGTANVLIHLKGRGIVINEPALVAVDTRSNEVIEVGENARVLLGKAPQSIDIIQPIKGGVIADFDLSEAMLIMMLRKIHSNRWFSKPNVLLSCPANISEVERRSLQEAAQRVVGGKVFIEEEPLLAGVGAGISPFDTQAHMVVDIGGGTSDAAILVKGEIVKSTSLRVAGNDLDQALVLYFKEVHQLLIGEKSAEQLKQALGTALKDQITNETYTIKGRDLITGLPRAMNVTGYHILEAIQESLDLIGQNVKRVIQDLPPEIASDIYDSGIILTGGGAMLSGLDQFLSDRTQVSVIRADQPMACVAIGSGLMLDLILSGKLERTHPSRFYKMEKWLNRLKKRILGI